MGARVELIIFTPKNFVLLYDLIAQIEVVGRWAEAFLGGQGRHVLHSDLNTRCGSTVGPDFQRRKSLLVDGWNSRDRSW